MITWRYRYRENELSNGQTLTGERPIRRLVRFCNEIANWLSNVIPSGGETGQVLVKKSDSDFDLEWGDGLPDDGDPGQVLTLNDELEAEWSDSPIFVVNPFLELEASRLVLYGTLATVDSETNAITETGQKIELASVPVKELEL